jgi:hypothetical protein
MLRKSYQLIRGDDWSGQAFIFKHPLGPDVWDNVVVRAQLRVSPDSTIIHTFTVTPVVTSEVINGTTYGVLSFSISMLASVTATLSLPRYLTDIEITADGFPRRTMATLTLSMSLDITHD